MSWCWQRPEADALALVRRKLPDMAADEVRLRILSAGICGTDLHIVRWNAWAATAYRPPFALGHEFCAEVVDVGEHVSHIRRGDRVVAETHLSCGHCRQCRADRRHTCDNLRVFSRLDRGAFADYAVVPAALLRRRAGRRAVGPRQPARAARHCGARRDRPARLRARPCSSPAAARSACSPIAAARASARIGSSLRTSSRGGSTLALAARRRCRDRCLRARRCATRHRRAMIDVAIDASGNARRDRRRALVRRDRWPADPDRNAGSAVALDLARHVLLREVVIRGLYGRLIDETWLVAERLMASPALRPVAPDHAPLRARGVCRGVRLRYVRSRRQGAVRDRAWRKGFAILAKPALPPRSPSRFRRGAVSDRTG